MNGRTVQDNRLPADQARDDNSGANGRSPQQLAEARNGREPAPNGNPDATRPEQARSEPGKLEPGKTGPGKADAARTGVPVTEAHWSERPIGRVDVPPLGEFTTPVRVDEIAVAAMALSENLSAATRGMPESVALREFRRELDQAASTFRTLAGKLEATAGSLVRLAANDGEVCGVGWGVCPEHGLTLMNVGETVSCHILGCNRPNEGAVERCEHPVAYRVVDAAGPALLTCAGHAIACRLYLENPVITAAGDSMELF
ncbi:hypothetical protein ACI2LF_10735 [Kribbella sp. NPDC020789]